eukprot:scaffold12414_cov84-Cyclotella_meneghiniana.AAC.8
MAESNPPPTPHDRTHASIADVHHGESAVPVHMHYEAHDGSILFQPGENEKCSSASVEGTPAPPSVPPNPYKKRKPSTPAAPAPADTPSASCSGFQH